MKAVVLILDLTNDCNLRCSYCYASGGEHADCLSVSDAVLAIEKFYNRFKCQIQVLFHGGEPLLCFDSIQKIISITETKDFSNYISWFIQTNGVLLSQEKIDFLKYNNVNIGISLDGVTDESNCSRKKINGQPSTKETISALNLLHKSGISTSILTVVNANNYSLILHELKILISMGIRNVALNPYISAGRGSIANLGVTNEQMFNLFKDLSDMILSLYYKDNIIFIEKNLFHIVKKIVTGGNSYMCMSNPCGAGLSQFTVDPNADVYPCADLCGQKHFRLGNIGEDFFPMIPSCEGWREIRSYKLQNLTGCKKCTLIKTCPAGCSVRCYYSNDSVHSTDPLCGFYKLILPYLDDTGLAKKYTIFTLINRQSNGGIFYEPKQCISRKSHKETNARVLQKFRE